MRRSCCPLYAKALLWMCIICPICKRCGQPVFLIECIHEYIHMCVCACARTRSIYPSNAFQIFTYVCVCARAYAFNVHIACFPNIYICVCARARTRSMYTSHAFQIYTYVCVCARVRVQCTHRMLSTHVYQHVVHRRNTSSNKNTNTMHIQIHVPTHTHTHTHTNLDGLRDDRVRTLRHPHQQSRRLAGHHCSA
jgi:hypothetical protein